MTNPMNIGIDARLIIYRRGMGNFIYNLLTELAKLPTNHHFYLYVDDVKALQAISVNDRFTFRVLPFKLYPLWEQILLPLQASRDKVDLLHCPANTAPLWLSPSVRLVMTIHDLMYMLPKTILPTSPSLYQRLGKHYRRLVVPWAARRAKLILSDSEHTKCDIVTKLNLDENCIHVVLGAHTPIFRKINDNDGFRSIKNKFNLTKRVIVGLGAIDPRKNTHRVLQAFSLLEPSMRMQCQLVIVGINGKALTHFTNVAKQLGILSDVVFLPFVSEEELVALYNIAEIVVYPSLYEGFGLPILEAMACGSPVISSNNSSIPEVAGNAALLIEPTNSAILAEAMFRLLTDEPLRLSLIERGFIQSAKFSWVKAAKQTLQLYEEV